MGDKMEKYTLKEHQSLHIEGTDIVLEKGDTIEYVKTETNPAKRIAEYLHGKMCHHNHIDECKWYHEQDWDGYFHKEWLHKACKFTEFLHRKGMFFITSIDAPLVEEYIDLFSTFR